MNSELKVNKTQELAIQELSHGERFTQMVINNFPSTSIGIPKLTEHQEQLIQGYFITIGNTLKKSEIDRIKNNKKSSKEWENDLSYNWNNVNLQQLAMDIIYYARAGLDMQTSNHLFPIPFKNNATKTYDINLMLGYNGIEYMAKKYAMDELMDVTSELVYEKDTFKTLKKSITNNIESYIFEIESPFDRGDLIGGFGYIEYKDPRQNKLVIMSKADLEKRKNVSKSAVFWKSWTDEMYLKTLRRFVYSARNIPRDPRKIDEFSNYVEKRSRELSHLEMEEKINLNANSEFIDDPSMEFIEPPTDIEIVDFSEEVADEEFQDSETEIFTVENETKISDGPGF